MYVLPDASNHYCFNIYYTLLLFDADLRIEGETYPPKSPKNVLFGI